MKAKYRPLLFLCGIVVAQATCLHEAHPSYAGPVDDTSLNTLDRKIESYQGDLSQGSVPVVEILTIKDLVVTNRTKVQGRYYDPGPQRSGSFSGTINWKHGGQTTLTFKADGEQRSWGTISFKWMETALANQDHCFTFSASRQDNSTGLADSVDISLTPDQFGCAR